MTVCTTCCPQPVAVSITNYTTSTFPVGYMYEIGVSEPLPSGALLCDGSAVSRTVYSELFETIGVSYGMGDGSTTFNLPNRDSTDSLFRWVIQAVNQTSQLVANRKIADITIVNSGTTSTATIQIQDSNGTALSGSYLLHWWFVDSASNLGQKSVLVPTTPGVNEGEVTTNTSGAYTFNIANTNPMATYYLVVSMGDELFVSSAISVGV